MSNSRSTHVRAILGSELSSRLPQIKVLLVGAGGIGCELLKNVVLAGFGDITLLDLDTIDLSNLNRQFLFRKKDIKQSKAMVAARTANHFNPSICIRPVHANIKEPEFDVEWFKRFDIVLNALDNLDARRHVNKMCLAASVPLVESGTAGYLGQVQPIFKGITECFDCMPKPTPKTFPVCTIRSTPSQPIHCIVWAKSYLLPQLFGEDEDAGTELDEAEKQGENAQEIAALRKEAQAFTIVRRSLRRTSIMNEASGSEDPARAAFRKVFTDDIYNLLKMTDMWRSRVPPTPLDINKILDGSFDLVSRVNGVALSTVSKRKQSRPEYSYSNGNGNGKTSGIINDANDLRSDTVQSRLKDQRELSLRDSTHLFISSTHRLAARLRSGEETISFDKDDEDTLDFVTAAANLRAAIYGIPGKSRWEVKEMAGNIIPAIATTNAIIAGAIVLQAICLLKKEYTRLRSIHLQLKPEMPLNGSIVGTPSKSCGVCQDTYTELLCDINQITLIAVIEGILGKGDGDGTGPRDVSVYEDKRILSDPDFDDNLNRTLASLNVTRGKFLTIVDEDGEWGNIAVAIGNIDGKTTNRTIILPSPLPVPTRLSKTSSGRKRSAAEMDDDDEIVEAPSPKRFKTNGSFPNVNLSSPSKKRRLEDEGLLIVDNPDDNIDDEPELITIID